MPRESDPNRRKGATQPPVCLCTRPVLFPPNKRLFLYFPSLWEFFFTQSRRTRVSSLTTGLVAIGFSVLTAASQPQQAEISLTECWAHKLEFDKDAMQSKSLQLRLMKRICLPMQETWVQRISSPGKSHNVEQLSPCVITAGPLL